MMLGLSMEFARGLVKETTFSWIFCNSLEAIKQPQTYNKLEF